MGDTKVTALSAIGTLSFDDLLLVIDDPLGTPASRKVTMQTVRDLLGPHLISGATGAANANAAPSETWQVLTSDAGSNSTTTLATVMTTQSLPIGMYAFKYLVRYQSTVTTTGVKFTVDYGGTVTWVLARHSFAVEASAASSMVPDSGFVGTAAGLATVIEFRADAGVAGPTASTDVAGADMLWMIEGFMEVSTSADLVLQHASEVAAASIVKEGTMLLLKRLQ